MTNADRTELLVERQGPHRALTSPYVSSLVQEQPGAPAHRADVRVVVRGRRGGLPVDLRRRAMRSTRSRDRLTVIGSKCDDRISRAIEEPGESALDDYVLSRGTTDAPLSALRSQTETTGGGPSIDGARLSALPEVASAFEGRPAARALDVAHGRRSRPGDHRRVDNARIKVRTRWVRGDRRR